LGLVELGGGGVGGRLVVVVEAGQSLAELQALRLSS